MMLAAAWMMGTLVTANADMRVELYEEVERGDATAGADKHVTPEGKVYGMGRADHRPVVRRCVLELDAKARAALPQQKLVFLPYFGEARPDTTLAAYFEAQRPGQASARSSLLPTALTAYLARPAATRASLDTLVEPDGTGASSVVIVWADERRWYVDRMFYRFTNFEPTNLPRKACDDVFTGPLTSFLRDSPLIALKRTEGIPALQHPKAPPSTTPETPVIELRLSPGMPNTSSYTLEVFADGSYRYASGRGGRAGVEPHRLAQLLANARQAGLDRTATPSAPPPQGHDEQVTTLRMHVGAARIDERLSSASPRAVIDFVAEVKKAYGVEL